MSSKKSPFSGNVAVVIDWAIVALVPATGLLHPSPGVYYITFLTAFVLITIPLLLVSTVVYFISEARGRRIQGPRRENPPIGREIFGTVRAMFLVAAMAAWPAGLYRIGLPTGLAWTLDEMGLSWWMAVLQMYLGIVAVDAWTYWKHRILHTRLLFPFHKHHHTFRDPTPFAGFAVGPVETVLTFWPLLLICHPLAKHFAPLYFTAIVSFVLLNLYLHCGVTFAWLEKIFPRIMLNSSAWHNVHHSDANVNFGEVSYIWDKICGTSKAKALEKRAQRVNGNA